MPKATCHFNLIVDQETGDQIDAIAAQHRLRSTSATRALILERLQLHAAGWDLADPRRMTALEAVARLNEEKFARLVEFLKEELTPCSEAISDAEELAE